MSSPDPVLAAHELEPLVYRIGQHTPISIRDQVLRAMYLAQRLERGGLLDEASEIAIVGAGAAGITAAVQLAPYCKHVLLIEQSAQAMSLQAKVNTRIVDPAQYDWPAAHWHQGQWPIRDCKHRDPAQPLTAFHMPVVPPFGLPLMTAKADDWAATFQNVLQGSPEYLNLTLTLETDAQMVSWQAHSTKVPAYVELAYQQHGWTHTVNVDLLILCIGMGTERASLNGFEGLEFWGDDDFTQPDLGMQPHSVEPAVILSGGGDGALQDFIRLVSGHSRAAEVLQIAAQALGKQDRFLAQLERKLWHWEENTQRTLLWAGDALDRCQALSLMHWRHRQLVLSILSDSNRRNNIFRAFDHMTQGRPIQDIRMVFPCHHFSQAYPLNRFVSLLLEAFIRNRFGVRPFLMNKSVVGTRHHAVAAPGAITHPTAKCLPGCWGQPHDVYIQRNVTCDQPLPQPHLLKPYKRLARGLVIRHGIEPPAILTGQMLPQASPLHLP